MRSAFDSSDEEKLRRTVRQAVAEALGPIAAYLDPASAAAYTGMSLRTFDSLSKNIPCVRLTPKGKRLYKREDLDAFMSRYRVAPADPDQVDDLVDDVLAQIRTIR